MSLLERIRRAFNGDTKTPGEVYKMITVANDSYFAYDGKVYKSDIVRACIRPYVKAMGKTVAKHIYESVDEEGNKNVVVNPNTSMRIMLQDPNPYMSLQMLTEKVAWQLKLNGNAFILIVRDDNGIPRQLFPMPASGAMAEWLDDGELAIRFYFSNGKVYRFRYRDLIHLRGDFFEHDIMGDNVAESIVPLMDCVSTMDKGIIEAIKSSAVIRWILKLNGGFRKEDIKTYAEDFAKDYLAIESSSGIGVAATDTKADIKQVEPKNYVPNAAQQDRQKERIYEFFNTNEDIVKSQETGDVWNSYYEHVVEPDVRQMSDEYTRKLFTIRQRTFGNYIMFEAYNLQMATLEDKLQLREMVDRGALLVNEWRYVMGYGPVAGGDVPIRRLDTAVVNQIRNLANRINGKDPETDRALIETINKLIEGRPTDGIKQLPDSGERNSGSAEPAGQSADVADTKE